MPKKHEKDYSSDQRQFNEGMFQINKQEFLGIFQNLKFISQNFLSIIRNYLKKIFLIFTQI